MIYVFFFFFFYFNNIFAWEMIDSTLAIAESHFIFVHDTLDVKIMTVPLISDLMQSAPVSIRGTDLCALIKRRFIPRAWQLCKRHISTSIV